MRTCIGGSFSPGVVAGQVNGRFQGLDVILEANSTYWDIVIESVWHITRIKNAKSVFQANRRKNEPKTWQGQLYSERAASPERVGQRRFFLDRMGPLPTMCILA